MLVSTATKTHMLWKLKHHGYWDISNMKLKLCKHMVRYMVGKLSFNYPGALHDAQHAVGRCARGVLVDGLVQPLANLVVVIAQRRLLAHGTSSGCVD